MVICWKQVRESSSKQTGKSFTITVRGSRPKISTFGKFGNVHELISKILVNRTKTTKNIVLYNRSKLVNSPSFLMLSYCISIIYFQITKACMT